MVVVRNIALLTSRYKHAPSHAVALNRFNSIAQLMVRIILGNVSHNLQLLCNLYSEYLSKLQTELQLIRYEWPGVWKPRVRNPSEVERK